MPSYASLSTLYSGGVRPSSGGYDPDKDIASLLAIARQAPSGGAPRTTSAGSGRLGGYSALMNLMRMAQGQQRLVQNAQKLANGGVKLTAKEREKLEQQTKLQQAQNAIYNNEDFRRDYQQAMQLSAQKAQDTVNNMVQAYIKPTAAQFGADANQLADIMMGRLRTETKQRVKDVAAAKADYGMESFTSGLKHFFSDTLPYVFRSREENEAASREYLKEQEDLRQRNAYARDQALREAEGEGFFERGSGSTGSWLANMGRMAGESAPMVAATIATGGLAGAGAGALGLGVQAANAARIAGTLGMGSLTGGEAAHQAFGEQIMSDTSLSPEQQRAALDSPERLGVTAIGAALGGLPLATRDIYRAVAPRIGATSAGREVERLTGEIAARNAIPREISEQVGDYIRTQTIREVTPEITAAARQQALEQVAAQQAYQDLAPGFLQRVVNQARWTLPETEIMNVAQGAASNALYGSATGQDIPLTTGMEESLAEGIPFALFGAIGGAMGGRGRTNFLRTMRSDGTRKVTPAELANTINEKIQAGTLGDAVTLDAIKSFRSDWTSRGAFDEALAQVDPQYRNMLGAVYDVLGKKNVKQQDIAEAFATPLTPESQAAPADNVTYTYAYPERIGPPADLHYAREREQLAQQQAQQRAQSEAQQRQIYSDLSTIIDTLPETDFARIRDSINTEAGYEVLDPYNVAEARRVLHQLVDNHYTAELMYGQGGGDRASVPGAIAFRNLTTELANRNTAPAAPAQPTTNPVAEQGIQRWNETRIEQQRSELRSFVEDLSSYDLLRIAKEINDDVNLPIFDEFDPAKARRDLQHQIDNYINDERMFGSAARQRSPNAAIVFDHLSEEYGLQQQRAFRPEQQQSVTNPVAEQGLQRWHRAQHELRLREFRSFVDNLSDDDVLRIAPEVNAGVNQTILDEFDPIKTRRDIQQLVDNYINDERMFGAGGKHSKNSAAVFNRLSEEYEAQQQRAFSPEQRRPEQPETTTQPTIEQLSQQYHAKQQLRRARDVRSAIDTLSDNDVFNIQADINKEVGYFLVRGFDHATIRHSLKQVVDTYINDITMFGPEGSTRSPQAGIAFRHLSEAFDLQQSRGYRTAATPERQIPIQPDTTQLEQQLRAQRRAWHLRDVRDVIDSLSHEDVLRIQREINPDAGVFLGDEFNAEQARRSLQQRMDTYIAEEQQPNATHSEANDTVFRHLSSELEARLNREYLNREQQAAPQPTPGQVRVADLYRQYKKAQRTRLFRNTTDIVGKLSDAELTAIQTRINEAANYTLADPANIPEVRRFLSSGIKQFIEEERRYKEAARPAGNAELAFRFASEAVKARRIYGEQNAVQYINRMTDAEALAMRDAINVDPEATAKTTVRVKQPKFIKKMLRLRIGKYFDVEEKQGLTAQHKRVTDLVYKHIADALERRARGQEDSTTINGQRVGSNVPAGETAADTNTPGVPRPVEAPAPRAPEQAPQPAAPADTAAGRADEGGRPGGAETPNVGQGEVAVPPTEQARAQPVAEGANRGRGAEPAAEGTPAAGESAGVAPAEGSRGENIQQPAPNTGNRESVKRQRQQAIQRFVEGLPDERLKELAQQVDEDLNLKGAERYVLHTDDDEGLAALREFFANRAAYSTAKKGVDAAIRRIVRGAMREAAAGTNEKVPTVDESARAGEQVRQEAEANPANVPPANRVDEPAAPVAETPKAPEAPEAPEAPKVKIRRKGGKDPAAPVLSEGPLITKEELPEVARYIQKLPLNKLKQLARALDELDGQKGTEPTSYTYTINKKSGEDKEVRKMLLQEASNADPRVSGVREVHGIIKDFINGKISYPEEQPAPAAPKNEQKTAASVNKGTPENNMSALINKNQEQQAEALTPEGSPRIIKIRDAYNALSVLRSERGLSGNRLNSELEKDLDLLFDAVITGTDSFSKVQKDRYEEITKALGGLRIDTQDMKAAIAYQASAAKDGMTVSNGQALAHIAGESNTTNNALNNKPQHVC